MSNRRGSRTPITKEELMASLEDDTTSALGFRLVQFESSKIGEYDEVFKTELKRVLIPKIVTLIASVLLYTKKQLHEWIIGHPEPRFDTTALFNANGLCIGAAISFFWGEQRLLLSHLTGVHKDYQVGNGIGEFLRRAQLKFLRRSSKFRNAYRPGKRFYFFSLAAKVVPGATDQAGKRGAVQFNTIVFTQKLGWKQSGPKRTEKYKKMVETNFPEFKLEKFGTDIVQALLFYSEEITPLQPANTTGPSNAVQQSAVAGPSNA
eukprot:4006722-Pleurochrysis_carterae.AAC.1